MNAKRLVLLLVVFALAQRAGAVRLPSSTGESTGTTPVLERVDFEQRLGTPVPLDAVFRDETGQPVRLGDYFQSKPVILTLSYYECPMLCTLVLNGLTSALRALRFDLGKEFVAVNVSFNPRESHELAAAKKATYLKEYRRPGAEAGWHFLTGDEDAIRRLTEAVGFRYAWDERNQQYAHATGLVVLTPTGRIARYFYGVEFSPRDLRFALIEAAEGKIGSPVDKLLLYCFHYDPATGRYSALALNSVRVGGALTLVALVTFIVVMLRRERRMGGRSGHSWAQGGAAP
ncbi:MAG: electron transporter SenC [Candidatus Binatia bacterium]|nr:MAG: electron transporter SenC [Candidatus Binatia bacterium]